MLRTRGLLRFGKYGAREPDGGGLNDHLPYPIERRCDPQALRRKRSIIGMRVAGGPAPPGAHDPPRAVREPVLHPATKISSMSELLRSVEDQAERGRR